MDNETLTEIVKIQSQLIKMLSAPYLDSLKRDPKRDIVNNLINDLEKLQE